MLVLMLQLVPTIPPDPAAAPDVATVVSGIMDQIIAAAAPQVQATGMAMWRGLAAILVAWTGLRIAFTGDFDRGTWFGSSSLSGSPGRCSASITLPFPDRPCRSRPPLPRAATGSRAF